jgi:hypothetical protein
MAPSWARRCQLSPNLTSRPTWSRPGGLMAVGSRCLPTPPICLCHRHGSNRAHVRTCTHMRHVLGHLGLSAAPEDARLPAPGRPARRTFAEQLCAALPKLTLLTLSENRIAVSRGPERLDKGRTGRARASRPVHLADTRPPWPAVSASAAQACLACSCAAASSMQRPLRPMISALPQVPVAAPPGGALPVAPLTGLRVLVLNDCGLRWAQVRLAGAAGYLPDVV